MLYVFYLFYKTKNLYLKYSLHITGCIFKENSLFVNVCMCIRMIKGEQPNPIEIENTHL